MNEVCAGTCADLEDFPLSQRDDPLPNFPDGFRIAKSIDEPRVNMISVEGHRCAVVPHLSPSRKLYYPAVVTQFRRGEAIDEPARADAGPTKTLN